ncbi:hypothetical protein EDM57_05035 [Brevibacillus gelatini]|uniref:Uncharacterized protein n=1 Tax=Brevibacillus gelatini TaxID=1655277 RepID=A0A3M8B959_9BACL|nr:hypothetical protein [Brevibacillus gelatini]RNB59507.1 hypothetical protein EDM57_05035 [Brevibacillus gelatini]
MKKYNKTLFDITKGLSEEVYWIDVFGDYPENKEERKLIRTYLERDELQGLRRTFDTEEDAKKAIDDLVEKLNQLKPAN